MASPTTAAPSVERNVELLHASERIQKLTVATDSLVARDFILAEKDSILDQLEAYVTELEGDIDDVEHAAADLRTRCALLRPGTRGALAGQSSEVNALWRQHGASMTRLLKLHAARLVDIEAALAKSAGDDENEADSAGPATAALRLLDERQK